MATLPRLVIRGRTFYFRASVPQDLWAIAGRKEVKISLRTAVRSLALMRCRTISSVANMRDVLFGTNSTNSPDVLLRGLLKRPPQEFWPLFHEFWPTCDNTWRWGERFLRLLQRNSICDICDQGQQLLSEGRVARIAQMIEDKMFESGAVDPDHAVTDFPAHQVPR